jgi:hypothetical protein
MTRKYEERMEELDYRIVVPTRGRADVIAKKTFSLIPSATYMVPAEQEDDYRKALGKDTDMVTTKACGCGNTFREAWSRFNEYSVLCIDDDVTKMKFINGQKPRKITREEDVLQALENTMLVARGIGASLFLSNNSANPMFYSTMFPFSLKARNNGALKGQNGKVKLPLDKGFIQRDDIPIIIEAMVKDHFIFTDLRLYLDPGETFAGKGGSQTTRTAQVSDNDNNLLKQKYGTLIKLGTRISDETSIKIPNQNDKVRMLFK